MAIEVRFYEKIEDGRLKFAVILARSGGKWVFCKHRERDTLEGAGGGHRTDRPQGAVRGDGSRQIHDRAGLRVRGGPGRRAGGELRDALLRRDRGI